MTLEKELDYFNQHRDELLKHHAGSFALIVDDEFLGAFTTEAEAYEAGLRRVGNRPLLIKRVAAEDEIVRVPALTLGVLDARSQ